MNKFKSTLRYSILAALSLFLFSNVAFADQNWDTPPSVKKSVAPKNPSKIDGMVSATVDIDETGIITNAVINKATDPSLEDPVLEALKKWRFAPAQAEGKAIACTIKVPFKFKG